MRAPGSPAFLAEKFSQVIYSLRACGPAIRIAESDPRLIGELADQLITIERGEIV